MRLSQLGLERPAQKCRRAYSKQFPQFRALPEQLGQIPIVAYTAEELQLNPLERRHVEGIKLKKYFLPGSEIV